MGIRASDLVQAKVREAMLIAASIVVEAPQKNFGLHEL